MMFEVYIYTVRTAINKCKFYVIYYKTKSSWTVIIQSRVYVKFYPTRHTIYSDELLLFQPLCYVLRLWLFVYPLFTVSARSVMAHQLFDIYQHQRLDILI